MTSELHQLCTLDQLEEGAITSGTLADGHRVAIYLVGGEVFVTDDSCSHGNSSLSDEGSLEGCTVECSWHFGTFDIRTGQALASPCTEPIRTYQVTVRDGTVFVAVSQAIRVATAFTSTDAACSH